MAEVDAESEAVSILSIDCHYIVKVKSAVAMLRNRLRERARKTESERDGADTERQPTRHNELQLVTSSVVCCCACKMSLHLHR